MRQVGQQVVRVITAVIVIGLLLLLLGMIAIWLQAGRDETRQADLMLVAAPDVPAQQLIDQSFELYRRGYAPQMLLLGEGQQALRQALSDRGVPEELLLPSEPTASLPQHTATAAAFAAGAQTVLVVAPPAETLLWLKIARDDGLRAYSAPPRGVVLEPLELVQASAAYWRYVLLGN